VIKKLLMSALVLCSAACFLTACGQVSEPGQSLQSETHEEQLKSSPPDPTPLPSPEPAVVTDHPKPPKYVIDVSVATLWKEPGLARPIDEPSLQNPVHMAHWIQKMKLKDKLWLVGRTESQALLGQEVRVLENRGDWSKVVILEQSTRKNAEGYPGWLPASQLTLVSEDYMQTNAKYALVHQPISRLLELESPQISFMEISFNTRLPVTEYDEEWAIVDTPSDGLKRIRREDVLLLHQMEERAQPKGKELVQAARTFLELPYLWAGASGFGFDCSGFTYSLYRHFGISIPRDTIDQVKAGAEVKRSELQPGDLIFFAYEQGKGKVHHVAMYAGDGLMIHSPRTERSVELIPLSTPEYAVEYAGARRILD
jgi:gamma-D-glutamyl-L-lysine dipeptidyl-peptidase